MMIKNLIPSLVRQFTQAERRLIFSNPKSHWLRLEENLFQSQTGDFVRRMMYSLAPVILMKFNLHRK